MEGFKSGDVLLHKPDNSKWKFLHYRPTGEHEFVTTLADYNGERRQSDDKSWVHVKAWDNDQNRWAENSHEEFPAALFEKIIM